MTFYCYDGCCLAKMLITSNFVSCLVLRRRITLLRTSTHRRSSSHISSLRKSRMRVIVKSNGPRCRPKNGGLRYMYMLLREYNYDASPQHWYHLIHNYMVNYWLFVGFYRHLVLFVFHCCCWATESADSRYSCPTSLPATHVLRWCTL